MIFSLLVVGDPLVFRPSASRRSGDACPSPPPAARRSGTVGSCRHHIDVPIVAKSVMHLSSHLPDQDRRPQVVDLPRVEPSLDPSLEVDVATVRFLAVIGGSRTGTRSQRAGATACAWTPGRPSSKSAGRCGGHRRPPSRSEELLVPVETPGPATGPFSGNPGG